jgi:hypothetical protein
MAAGQQGSLAAWQLGSLAAWQLGSLAAWQMGSLAASAASALFVNFNIEQIIRRLVSKQVLKLEKLEKTDFESKKICSIFLID